MAVFDYILSLSLRGSILIAVVALIRQLIRHYPKKYSYALWCIVFFSLVVQITVPTDFANPLNTPQRMAVESYEAVTHSYAQEVEIHHSNTEEYSIAVGKGVVPIQTQTENYVITTKDSYEAPKTIGEILLPKLHFVWMAGVVLLFVMYLKNVVDIISLLKFSVCCKNDIYYNEYIKTPFTFGFFRAKIYLPSDIDSNEAQYIIAHEKVHISRFDHIAKPLFLFITILHWFNPLVWLAFSLMTKDMELSCDEKVIKGLGNENKKEYCTALLHFALKDKPYKMNVVLFGESNCSQRIKNVLNFKQPKKIMAAVLGVIIAVVAVSTIGTMGKPVKENTFAGMSIEELDKAVPDSDEEKLMIWQAMDMVEDAEIENYLAQKIKSYCAEDDFALFRDITVHQDHLTLVYGESKKPLQNATAHITLELQPYDNVDIKTEAEEYVKAIADRLAQESEFFSFKVEATGYTVKGENGSKIAYSDADVTDSFENPTIWLNWRSKGPKVWYAAQSEAELAAQKVAFDGVKGDDSFMLKKFGITEDGTLRMEYHVEDKYLLAGDGDAEEKLAEQTADLNNIYAEISQKVLTHKAVKQYTEINGVKKAVIAFSHRFLENGMVEFPVILTEKEFIPDYNVTTHDGIGGEKTAETEEQQYTSEEADKADSTEVISYTLPYIEAGEFICPIDIGQENVNISRGFSMENPKHTGVDIAAPYGTDISASADGVVTAREETAVGNGYYIIIEHENGMRTLYAHCSQLLVNVGDTVKQGDVVAKVGSTGNSTGNHLHFEVLLSDDTNLNPDALLK